MISMILRDIRLNASITQRELAEKLCKPQSFISKYESGERRVDVEEFVDICRALEVDPSDVIKALKRRPVREF